METTPVRTEAAPERETARDLSTRDLVQDLSRQTSTLIRQEMRLAQAELAEKGRHAGKGAGMFGGAGLVALYGVGALVAAAILGLATVIEPWIAAAAIGVALLLLAGILALTGKKEIDEMGPPKPEQTIESVQRDVETVKERARS
jgi:Putative Actinobacterial Holin-X, holin superfamily III